MQIEIFNTLADSICSKFNITFYDASRDTKFYTDIEGREYHKNRGWNTSEEIGLGEFDDPYCRIISFFHELGHIRYHVIWKDIRTTKQFLLLQEYGRLGMESFSWRYGCILIKKYNIMLSKESYHWAIRQLLSYTTNRHVSEYSREGYNTCPTEVKRLAIKISMLK